MLRQIILGSMVFLAGSASVVLASGKEDATAAIQKLADSPNYSWTTTSANANGGRGFGGGPADGKATKDGVVTYNQTMRENTYTVIIQGGKAAIKTADGWKAASDLTGGDPGPDMFAAMMATNFKTPVQQAQTAIEKLDDLKPADGALTADLPEDTVKQMLSFRRPNAGADAPPPPDITGAKGSVKIWIKDGVLSKIEFHVQGTVSFNGNDRDVDRTTTTEFKDVGSTTVDVPDEAKAILNK